MDALFPLNIFIHLKKKHSFLLCRYCDPAYAFPSQREAIQFAVSTAKKAMEQEPRTLVVCGAYTIGKERIFMGNHYFSAKYSFTGIMEKWMLLFA